MLNMLASILISIAVYTPTGQPIPKAIVIVDNITCADAEHASCLTDSAGKMYFEIMPGKRLVTVHKSGYETWVAVITFVPERPNAKITLLPVHKP